ncbi:MAG TPA: ABC transporter permease subunit, partial [Polyangiaceae bacterium]|nr:ABC transporter permease subunit [Polyangiaceae bacterium]
MNLAVGRSSIAGPRWALLFLLSLVTLSVFAELLVGSQPVIVSINGQLQLLPGVIGNAEAGAAPQMDWAIWPLIRTGAHFNAAGWGTLLQWWMYATRYSLLVTALVALLASLAGAVGGWLAAGGPRFFDFSLRKVVEISGALPGLILVAALRVSGLVPPGLDVMLVLFVLRSIEIAHLVRSLMLSLGDRDFLIAARSIGGSPLHILRWHLLPHLARPLGALVVTTLASVVSLEAALSVIGLG